MASVNSAPIFSPGVAVLMAVTEQLLQAFQVVRNRHQ